MCADELMEARLPNNVLFVDDDYSMRVAWGNAARALGIEATLAESGWQALELAEHESFPVVVTDLRMPGLDGLALIERMAALDPSTAFVLVSATAELEPGRRRAADGAITALLGKPVQLTDLETTLARSFALHLRRKAELAPPDSTRSGWSLLVVEDSSADAEFLRDLLLDLPGVELYFTTRLRDALELAHEQKFDCIVTDLTLPDARGFDAVLKLQAGAPTAAIVAYTGLPDESLSLQLVQLGAQDLLLKGATSRETLLRSVRFARERKRAELRLRRLAHYDQLTGLANRVSFGEALMQAVARAQRHEQLLAVMMIDLDGFKAINDSAGHDAGDQLLQELGARLRRLFREYDVVARLGGDEFAVLLTDVESTAVLSEIAQRLLDSLALPTARGHRVTGSVGIAVFPDAGSSPGRLLHSADLAMYQAKSSGKNRFRYYRESSARPSSVPAVSEDRPSGSRLLASRAFGVGEAQSAWLGGDGANEK